jgi:Zn-dependent M28 family amino/carboxypeptidase
MSEAALRAHVEALAADDMEGRLAGSKGERLAADYLARAFDAAGVAVPRDAKRLQTVRLHDLGGDSVNVLGVVLSGDATRADEFVVVGAHIDHLGDTEDGVIYRGAEDNASGVAVLIEIGRALAGRRAELGRSVLLVGFGAEERGMIGSRAFVEQPPVRRERIAAMVNIDMIGRKLVDQYGLAPLKLLFGIPGDGVGIVGTNGRSWLRRIVDEACNAAGVRPIAPEDLPETVRARVEQVTAHRGDNVPFERAGIASVFFGAGESDDYHKPSDVIDKLDFPLMARRGRAILDTVIGLSRATVPR